MTSRSLSIDTNLMGLSGASGLAVELIQRVGKDVILNYYQGDRVVFPKELQKFVPLGNPPFFFAGYARLGDTAYLTSFFSKDNAVSLMVKFGSEILNPLLYISRVYWKLMEMTELDSKGDINFPIQIEKDGAINYEALANLADLSSLIFSFLAGREILIIGTKEDALEVIRSLLLLLPSEQQKNVGFAVNISDFEHESIKIYLYEDIPQMNVNQQIEQFMASGGDVVNLNENAVYGEYDSDKCIEIAEMIQNKTELAVIQDSVNKLIEIAKESHLDDELVEIYSIGFTDVDLIHQMNEEGY